MQRNAKIKRVTCQIKQKLKFLTFIQSYLLNSQILSLLQIIHTPTNQYTHHHHQPNVIACFLKNLTDIADIKMPFTEGAVIEGYEDFQSKIPLIEKDKSKKPLFILFTGSDGPDGISWCPDCVEFEESWEKLKESFQPSSGCLVRVQVGPRDYWKDKNCPFRTDKQLRLTSVPTLVKWGTVQKLSDADIQNPENVQMLMEE